MLKYKVEMLVFLLLYWSIVKNIVSKYIMLKLPYLLDNTTHWSIERKRLK